MNKLNQIIEAFPEEGILCADGLDDAVIGIEENTHRLIYSVAKIINILISRDEMSEEDAMEFYYYNIVGAYMGEKTPIFSYDLF